MARYDRNERGRVWYGGGGLEDGDSDVEYGYSAGGFGRGNFGGRTGPERGWRRGVGSDMEFGNWDDRSGLYGRGHGDYDRGFRGGYPSRGPGYGYDFRDMGRPARPRFTGMESNRYRGVYDSGFRAREGDWDDSHGGYRGRGWDRGGGMNPGRRRGW